MVAELALHVRRGRVTLGVGNVTFIKGGTLSDTPLLPIVSDPFVAAPDSFAGALWWARAWVAAMGLSLFPGMGQTARYVCGASRWIWRAQGVLLQGARFDGFRHVDDWVPQRLVTATGPNPLPR